MKGKITILDLAKKSGVSKSTVSRYLQGESVSKEKQKKIEEAISDMGYIRNSFAHFLRTNKSNLLGVLVPDLDNPFFVKIIKRLDELSQKEGKTLIIKTTQSNAETELDALKFIRGFLVDAIFLCRSELDDAEIQALNITIPAISIDKKLSSLNSVVSNNYQNGYILANHMFENTDKNVMFFAREKESASVLERIEGYKEYCHEHQKAVYDYRYDMNENIYYDDLLAYVKDNNIGAIISRNDNDAVKILSYLNDMTYKGFVSRIKVAGFDNINLSRRIIPTLTTIDQKIESMCDTAFNILMNHQRYTTPRIFIQQGELIIRQTSKDESVEI